ncbi:MAG: phycobilisome rod-core linker polypeptide, partial [Prochlorococcaceae cyanobacterium]
PFEGAPQYITLYASYRQPFPDQHPYGGGNDPLALNYGAIFPSGTASVRTRPVPFSYDARRILIGNGMAQPGQMNSPQFRRAAPRRVGPRVVRLQQIATGGNSVPRRGGQPSVRFSESSTQAVIRAVYAQVLGNSGYAGERNTVEEIKLENGDINLREFVRQVARSNAFRRRYWSGLYICKAIEVMHRRLLGRPTLGRWEIDAYFDTAARRGFYGVVEAMVGSKEYDQCFGDDTVPYERFLTPADRNARRIPALTGLIDPATVPDLRPSARPDVAPPQGLRTSGDLTPRNLAPRRVVRGSFQAKISGGAAPAMAIPSAGPTSVRQLPPPVRRWAPGPASRGVAAPMVAPRPGAPAPTTAFAPSAAPGWQARLSSGVSSAKAELPQAAMQRALKPGSLQGFAKRRGLRPALQLPANPS